MCPAGRLYLYCLGDKVPVCKYKNDNSISSGFCLFSSHIRMYVHVYRKENVYVLNVSLF